MAATLVADVLKKVRQADDRRPIVLISHSSSGAIAGLVAESAPELVDHLLYVAAIVPAKRRSAIEYAALPEYGSPTMDGLVVGDPATIGTLRSTPAPPTRLTANCCGRSSTATWMPGRRMPSWSCSARISRSDSSPSRSR